MKPLGSLNLQGFFVFRIVQFSRYQFVIFIDPLHLAAFLLYHIAYRLSRGFLNFFKVFWAPDSWYRSPLEAAYLVYHISFGLSSTFSKFLFPLSVWVVFPALLATYLFYHTCLPLSTPGCFKSIQYILSIFMHIIQSEMLHNMCKQSPWIIIHRVVYYINMQTDAEPCRIPFSAPPPHYFFKIPFSFSFVCAIIYRKRCRMWIGCDFQLFRRYA